jgi:hypothetical protein
MSVSGISGNPSAAALQAERAVLVVKKQQDAVKDQAQMLVDLVKQSSDSVGQHINVLA